MTELLTAAQMRAIEAAAIASGEVTGLELMERAGVGVVAAVMEEWPALAEGPHRAVVLCGPGGNGGDGFVVARLLKERGWEVEVFLYGDPERMPPDARVNYERWLGMEGGIGDPQELRGRTFKAFANDGTLLKKLAEWTPAPRNVDLVIDAIFGIGLTRPLSREIMNALIDAGCLLAPHGKKVCIDLPSGICADSGRMIDARENYGPGVIEPHHPHQRIDLCVTFHRKKLGHVVGYGARLVSKIVVVDIGMSHIRPRDHIIGRQWETTREVVTSDWLIRGRMLCKRRHLDKIEPHLDQRKWTSGPHKFSFGHALVLSGQRGRGGAARLSARAALRAGAGLVTLGCPDDAVTENAARLDAIMLREIDSPENLLDYLSRHEVNAICLGPGLGIERARALVPVALSGGVRPFENAEFRYPPPARPGMPPLKTGNHEGGRGVVLDADAISAYADDPETLFGMLHERCVLTPHEGEFSRLFPDIAEKLAAWPDKGPAISKIDAAEMASKRADCTVLLKGADTVVCFQRLCAVNSATQERAAPWLATAGSGDVLAGLITGLLARGMHPLVAAETAAWLHVECARAFGPGLIAEDLPEMLPQVFRDLGLK